MMRTFNRMYHRLPYNYTLTPATTASENSLQCERSPDVFQNEKSIRLQVALYSAIIILQRRPKQHAEMNVISPSLYFMLLHLFHTLIRITK